MSFKDVAKGIGNNGPADNSAEGTILSAADGALADGRGLDEIAQEVIQGKMGCRRRTQKEIDRSRLRCRCRTETGQRDDEEINTRLYIS